MDYRIQVSVLPDLLQAKVAEAHEAQQDFKYFLREPPKPLRPLSGCCAGYQRRLKKWPMMPEDWAALGD
jgi:hypothetical protein